MECVVSGGGEWRSLAQKHVIMIVQCPACEKKNRIADSPEKGGEYRCGSCGQMLDVEKAARHPAKSLIPAFQQALRDEIDAIKEQGASRYYARNGHRLRRQAQFSVYEFEVDDIVVAADDSPVIVQVGNRNVKGSLISSSGFRVTLELEADIGERVAQAIISTSPQYLLERLNEMLEAMAQGTMTTFWPVLEKVFGPAQVKIGRDKSFSLTVNKTSREANPSKREAISVALGSEVSVIWGPPGTGKTTTLGLLVDAFLQVGFRVLVVAHTNVAVDQAVLKIIDACEGTSRIQEGKVVRFGSLAITDPEALDKLSETTLDGIVASIARLDRVQLERLEEEAARLEQLITGIENMKAIAEDEKRTQATLESEQRGWNGAKTKKDGLDERVASLSQQIRSTKERLSEIEQAGFLKKLLLSGERSRLESELHLLPSTIERARAELKSA